MARAPVAIILAALLLAPATQAAVVRVPDPARDILLTTQGLAVPVDSIDIVAFEVGETDEGARIASVELSDLSRRGFEDALFVHAAHSRRVYTLTRVHPDNTALMLVAVQFDDETTLRAAALHVRPPEATLIPVNATLDLASGTVTWTLVAPADLPAPALTFALAGLVGCDAPDACDAPLRGLAAWDVAPNDVAEPLAAIAAPLWWNDVA